jgi:hypothetical protein
LERVFVEITLHVFSADSTRVRAEQPALQQQDHPRHRRVSVGALGFSFHKYGMLALAKAFGAVALVAVAREISVIGDFGGREPFDRFGVVVPCVFLQYTIADRFGRDYQRGRRRWR